MRTVHRFLAVFFLVFGLYAATTGLTTQIIDEQALLRHAPATDPTMQAIRVGGAGPPNFQVIRIGDYAAETLPAGFDLDAALGAVMKGARAALGQNPVAFVEFRMVDGKPVGQVASMGQMLRFDAKDGAALGGPYPVTPGPMEQPSLRNTAKSVHRMGMFGPWAYAIDLTVGLSLATMILTGLVMYVRLLAARAKMGRNNPFWKAGGWWRTLHRATAISAGAFLTVLSLSGSFLAFNALGINIDKWVHHGRPGMTTDASRPLTDAELPDMLRATLAAYRRSDPQGEIRVLRLRYFGGMPQGAVVTGGEARQLVYNTATGRPALLYEPGYPNTGMPLGWEVGQIAKRIHRGDILGLPGRWMAMLTGLSLLYLCISGAAVYLDLWARRRKLGRHGLFWP
jgi:uncharacterized iron-regulated membrane protein